MRAAPLDAVDEVDVKSATEVRARKRIVATDPYLEGHYPGFPIYPGVFVAESASQAVEHLVRDVHGPEWVADLVEVRSARFTGALLPGDTLILNAACDPDWVTTVTCTNAAGDPIARLVLAFEVGKAEVRKDA